MTCHHSSKIISSPQGQEWENTLWKPFQCINHQHLRAVRQQLLPVACFCYFTFILDVAILVWMLPSRHLSLKVFVALDGPRMIQVSSAEFRSLFETDFMIQPWNGRNLNKIRGWKRGNIYVKLTSMNHGPYSILGFYLSFRICTWLYVINFQMSEISLGWNFRD